MVQGICGPDFGGASVTPFRKVMLIRVPVRHSSLGFVSPIQFLQDWIKAQQTKDAAA
ncbi:hypothetical protein LMG23994_06346 [Cupriavidus pinatubonensis]|uniref:Uncharacterized protein n=1 Tax=Cupriavidus pinatubonensis TaxID=248026 RepID=A0ABM8Y1T6_9BURK|nr:hypothetical protein LMG23994_06346 [Cupriavidus pinatubonensis]